MNDAAAVPVDAPVSIRSAGPCGNFTSFGVSRRDSKRRVTEGRTNTPHGRISVGLTPVKVDFDALRGARARATRNVGWVIDPRAFPMLPYWDMTMVVALVFTALVTPVEIVFLNESDSISSLWVINRFIDLLFFLDMLMSFLLAYQVPEKAGGYWVINRWMILSHYVRGWFFIDLISVLPLWLIAFDFDNPFGETSSAPVGVAANLTALADAAGFPTRVTILFRLLKVLRMIKIVRVSKASKVMERNLKDLCMHEWEMTYATIRLLQLVVIMWLYLHWQACLWGYVGGFEEPSWMTEFEVAHVDKFNRPPTWVDKYMAAFYWSGMTLTSIGYGEMLPVTTFERFISTVLMMSSGFMWSYVIGVTTMITTSLDPDSVQYQNDMDKLNFFMRDRALPKGLRFKLRDFFASSRGIRQRGKDQELLKMMSPLLQCTVALEANKVWLEQVWYLSGIGDYEEGQKFLAYLCKKLGLCGYSQNERLPLGQLYILTRGVVVRNWRFLGVGKVWGEDVMFTNPRLIDHAQAVAMTYSETYTLRRVDFEDSLGEHPELRPHIERMVRRITIRRALTLYLRSRAHRAVRSFIPAFQASGYELVDDQITVEQKIDAILASKEEPTPPRPGSPPSGFPSTASPLPPPGTMPPLGSVPANGVPNERKKSRKASLFGEGSSIFVQPEKIVGPLRPGYRPLKVSEQTAQQWRRVVRQATMQSATVATAKGDDLNC